MTSVSRIGWRHQNGQATDGLRDREWLVANGLGGYSSGTLAGGATRRYHGLLIAGLPNPLGRTMMFDHLVEELRLPDGTSCRLGGGAMGPDAPLPANGHLEEFRLEMGLPVWVYRFGEIVLEKRLVLTYMQNLSLIHI